MVIRFNMPTIIGVMYDPFIVLPPSLYDATSRQLFNSVCTTVGTKYQQPLYFVSLP